MADDSAPLVSAAGAVPEDDGAGGSVVPTSAADVPLASVVAAVFLYFFGVSLCFDAISIVVLFECLMNDFFLRMLELDWQTTVGVLSYICTLNCQSIRA